jgi:CheY-like chemotaxis protein
MDLKLPDMEGFEASRRIREITKDTAIIAITSYSVEEVREEITKAGFNGFIQEYQSGDHYG